MPLHRKYKALSRQLQCLHYAIWRSCDNNYKPACHLVHTLMVAGIHYEFIYLQDRFKPAVACDHRVGCLLLRPSVSFNVLDHFVACARYPADLAHNFVLADERCNNKKRDRLPACEHLAAWTERKVTYGDQLHDALHRRGIITDLAASNRVAN